MAEASNNSFFNKLQKLFSNKAIVTVDSKGKRKVVDTDDRQRGGTNLYNLHDRYTKLQKAYYGDQMSAQSMAYHQVRRELFRDYDCIHGDTVIPLPDGTYPTIKELTCKYGNTPDKTFHVFSFDHNTNLVKLGNAFNPRSKGLQDCYKVTLDNGESITATADHLFMRRDGSYVKLSELNVKDSLMPFYRKDFYDKGYKHIYNFSSGWVSEHKLVAEQFYRKLNDDEVVHHKNFTPKDNSPENLQIMTKDAHRKYHADIMNKKIWSPENRDKQIAKIREAAKRRPKYTWNGFRSGTNNPFFGKKHTDEHKQHISEIMKKFHSTYDVSGSNNANYRSDVTFEKIQTEAVELLKNNRLTIADLQKSLLCDGGTIRSRLMDKGMNWMDFKANTKNKINHKVKSIEYVGKHEVFDISVHDYHNFATTGIFVHNCMDNDPIISSALDIFSDESTLKDEFGDTIKIKTTNAKIKEILENLFYDVLNIEFNLWSWTRNMAKYGDFFLILEIKPKGGVINVHPASIYEIERLENTDPKNPNYVKFKINHDPLGKGEYENYEVAHFRLLSDTNFLPYGKAMIENSRRIWKQLSLMEDAMLIHRIMRAPEKRVFRIDIGNIPPNEVDNYMQKIINRMKKVPFVDRNTGDYNLKYNMQNLTEDFFLPVRGGDSGTSIDSLSGLDYSAIDDIDYLKAKLFASLKIPKAYLGYEEDINGKATIAAEDVRFARTIERIQKTLTSELTKIAIVHLSAQGIEGTDLTDFELSLVNPSTVYEQEKMNLWSEKIRLVADMKDLRMISKEWIYKNILNMTEDQIDEEKTKVINDLKDAFRYNAIENEGNDPVYENEETNNDFDFNDGDDGGRPKEGNTYGKDKHPYGRDPLGSKENADALKRESAFVNNRRAIKFAKQYNNRNNKGTKRVINETPTSFLDDSNIIDD